jgi:RHS repeat-associated protein
MQRNVYYDKSFAPFGDVYNETGSAERSFTGQANNLTTGLFDFMFREYDPTQGRWLQPDPAGLGAVDPTNPQSWNRYAYVLGNPLALVDLNGEESTGFSMIPIDPNQLLPNFNGFFGSASSTGQCPSGMVKHKGKCVTAIADPGGAAPTQQTPAKNVCAAITPPKGPINYVASAQNNANLGILGWLQAFSGGGTQDLKNKSEFGDMDNRRAAGNFNFGASVAAKGWGMDTAQALAGAGALISNTGSAVTYSVAQSAYMQGQYGGPAAPTPIASNPDWNMGSGYPLMPSSPTGNQGDQEAWYENQSVIAGYIWYSSGCHQ